MAGRTERDVHRGLPALAALTAERQPRLEDLRAAVHVRRARASHVQELAPYNAAKQVPRCEVLAA